MTWLNTTQKLKTFIQSILVLVILLNVNLCFAQNQVDPQQESTVSNPSNAGSSSMPRGT